MTEKCFNSMLLSWYNYYSINTANDIDVLDIENLEVNTICCRDDFKINKSFCVCTIEAENCKYSLEKKLYFTSVDLVEYNKDETIKDINCIDFEIINK